MHSSVTDQAEAERREVQKSKTLSMKFPQHQYGFTLIELAIAFVIIALITGGVLIGRDLIEAAKMRKVAAEYNEVATVLNTFKMKYNCLPGDCRNGAALGLGGNGDGDSKIWPYETRYVCNHLRLAVMVNSGCTGGFPNGINVSPNVNALPSAYRDKSLLEISYHYPSSPYTLHMPEAHYVSMGYESTTGNYYPLNAFSQGGMQPVHARSIDQKIDDGKPLSGKFVQWTYVCYTGTEYTTGYAGQYVCNSSLKLD